MEKYILSAKYLLKILSLIEKSKPGLKN